MRVELMCSRSFDCCFLIAASGDECRNRAGLGPTNTQLRFAFALHCRGQLGHFKDSLFCCYAPSQTLFSSFSPSPEGHTDVAEVQAAVPYIRLTLKDSEMLPFLPQPLYGGLMIYCSGFSLFSSYLEGGQFNKHAHFLPRPSDSPHSQRNVPWCHCVQHSCDPVRRLFHQNSLSGEQRNPARKPNPTGAAHSACCSKTLVLLPSVLVSHVHQGLAC